MAKQDWVNVRWVIKLTGWNKNDLRAARRDGTVKFSYNPVDGLRYDINSIPERLLIKKEAATTNS